ncbi:MAG TPA: hypothetical protein VF263_18045 [Longimicrobiaceae bacterium]
MVVGTPGSGKDLLIRAVHDLGKQHATIVPKHTSRERRPDDGEELTFQDDPDFDLAGSDLVYENYGSQYGIHFEGIWRGLQQGVFQVAVVSNIDAVNRLRYVFGSLVVLVFVHSEMSADEYGEVEAASRDSEYVQARQKDFEMAFRFYLRNYLAFDHVLLSSGAPEDLYDQIFRLFRAYESRLL